MWLGLSLQIGIKNKIQIILKSKNSKYIMYICLILESVRIQYLMTKFIESKMIASIFAATNPSDLRPISILPIPGKLLEKLITKKIENILEDNNFFSDDQNGFRKGKSTTSAQSKFLDNVIGSLNKYKICLAAYLDI